MSTDNRNTVIKFRVNEKELKLFEHKFRLSGFHSHVTVSGVNKKLGGAELDKHGGLEAFTEGFTFIDAGGTEAVYNDNPPVKWYKKGKYKAEVTPNVSILPSTYTLGISGEYDRILRYEENFLDNPFVV